MSSVVTIKSNVDPEKNRDLYQMSLKMHEFNATHFPELYGNVKCV